MGIKLKSKIKKYLNNIWLIEIVIIVITLIYSGLDIYNGKIDKSNSKVLSDIELVFSPQQYYKDKLEKDIVKLNTQLYSDYTFLFLLDEAGSTPFSSDSYRVLSEYVDNDVKFIFMNKNSRNIITNEVDSNLEESYYNEAYAYTTSENSQTYNSSSSSEVNEIEEFINDKYNSSEISIYYDNSQSINPFLKSKPKFVSSRVIKDTLKNYDEIYYTSYRTYYNRFESIMAYTFIFVLFIEILILIKILVVLIKARGKTKIRGNFIASIIYVFRYGFIFNQTRKALLISIIGLGIFFIGYLYLLAVGGYENNLIVTFFSRYPFKGSFLLMLLPMIGIIYSIKKSIDIYLVNERLKEIKKGNLDYEIVERGSTEIVELIQNIVEIKNGYKIAVEETLKNEKVKTELISNVSHDLRTPLTSIINYVNILGKGNLTEEERVDYLSILEQKSKKLKVLIDDLFEMSKINSGKIELKKDRIEIMSLIHQAIGEYSYLYEDKNVEFNVECINDEIYMNLDGRMMSRVFENLVINALKYSLENTRIYIEVKENTKDIEISVKNIANYKMEFNNNEVLERFVRGDKSRNSNIDGSGLGLAITKSIVELHNGRVSVVREGDMFKIYIYLPKE